MLRLLASELDGPAIARELVLSLNTVRTHTKNIYAKLGVTNRRAAVTRAHALNLLPRRTERPPGRATAKFTTYLTTRCDPGSPHRLLACGHPDGNRPQVEPVRSDTRSIP